MTYRSLAVPVLCALLAACQNGGDIQSVARIEASGSGVHLGEDIRAVPGQEVVVVAYFKAPRESLARVELTNPVAPDTAAGDYAPSSLTGFAVERSYLFRVPADPAIEGRTFSLDIYVEETGGAVSRDSVNLTVLPQERIGEEKEYAWDLRMFMEHKQPANAVPELSIFDVDGMRAVMDPLFPGVPRNRIPYPVLLQPQTSLKVGRDDIRVRCGLRPGQGFCVAFEDWLKPDTDGDYDFFFQVIPGERELVAYASPISPVAAKDRLDVLIRPASSKFGRVRVEVNRRRRGSDRWRSHSSREQALAAGTNRLTVWTDQNTVFRNGDGQQVYEAKIKVRLLE